NPSDAYVRTVLTWLGGYRQGGATPQTGTGNSSGSSDTGTSGTGDPIPETTASTASPNGLEGSGLGDIPIVTLTPTRPPTSPGSPPPAGPTSSPDPTPAGPTPPPTPDPDEEWELEACHPLRADDLAVTVTDLDPATPGAEALDITTTRRPWRTTTVTVETTATTTSGTPVASTRLQLEDDQEAGTPALLARIPGTSLANANLPDNALLLTLKATPADQHCPTHIRLRIRNITPAAFAPRPPAPTTTPPAPPPPASPPAASASPPAPPSTSTPPTPATTSAAPPDVSPSPSAT
ncbi:hypothetical protein MXD63_35175, partial [Frankia sp. Cpl3]|nr:hypothetical protein [Frankia sp. Cpl3]